MQTEKPIADLIEAERPRVAEALQSGGSVYTDENSADPMDWLRIIIETAGDIALDCRYDLNDPETNRSLRRRLARLVAICEAWDGQLN